MTHTVATLLETVCGQFEQHDLTYGHGTDNAWDEAVALVLTVTGHPDDSSALDEPVSATDTKRCLEIADERVASRVPLAYILGTCRYMGLGFEICPGVVVPRSPLGYLLQSGLEPWLPARVAHIVDLCSGSGCLGILAAHLYPQATVYLVELDPTALDLARRNVTRHGLEERVQVIAADVTQHLELPARCDLVISNPPYVDASDMSVLPAEFRAEPAMGLSAGDNGLEVIHAIISQLPNWISEYGLFIGEVGASAPALQQAYPTLPFVWPELEHGGEGVFLLEATWLNSHTARDSNLDNR